jgi:protein pelota
VNDVAKRKKYAALVEGVQAAGGEALVFSSMHVSGGAAGPPAARQECF